MLCISLVIMTIEGVTMLKGPRENTGMCCMLVNMVCFYEGIPYIRTCNSDDVIHYSKHYKLATCTCTLLEICNTDHLLIA